MKFNNVLGLAFHNLFNNKLRTILTIIVLLVMATVVMLLSAFGFSFYESLEKNTQSEFQKNGTTFDIVNYEVDTNRIRNIEMPMEKVQGYFDLLESQNIFSYIELKGGSKNVSFSDGKTIDLRPMYAKSNPFIGQENYLIDGRMWGKEDDNTNGIWLNSKFIDEYFVGQEIILKIPTLTTFVVKGFLNINNHDSYIDYRFFNFPMPESGVWGMGAEESTSLFLSAVGGKIITQKDFVYGTKTIKTLQKLEKEINTFKKGSGGIRVLSSILDEMFILRMLLLCIIGLLCLFCLIIILLSIGSVANTIKITVEQNRKFFGMMKAIGMQDKTVRRIVQWQVLVMVIASVGISTGIIYGLMSVMTMLMTMIMTSAFGSTAIIICKLSPLIPIVTAIVLIGSVLLFTRSSLNKISKMDVISVISEVN